MYLYADGIKYCLTIHQSLDNHPYLLMMHGFMGSGKVFHHLLEPLSEFCNPITIDLAGHGNTITPAESERFTAGRQVCQIHSILERLSFEHIYLYGYSMGGRLAFQLIINHHELFKGTIIESAHCGLKDEIERSERRKTDSKRAGKIKNDYHRFLEEWMKMPLFQGENNQHTGNYIEIMKKQNPERLSASLEGFGAGVMPFVCDKLEELNLPIYLVAGAYDKKYVNLLSSITGLNKQFTFKIVPGAGHRVHTDRPSQLIEIIKTAISKP